MQGGIGVGAAIAHFMKNETPVFVPLVDYTDYDLVIELDGLKKVQVRTSTCKSKNGNYAVNMKICGGNAKANKIHRVGSEMIYDYLFIHLETGIKYLIPKVDIASINSQIIMGTKYDKYKV